MQFYREKKYILKKRLYKVDNQKNEKEKKTEKRKRKRHIQGEKIQS